MTGVEPEPPVTLNDLCSQFPNFETSQTLALGFVALNAGIPIAGASSYCVYQGAIEIEVNTHPDFRRNGLATACCAKLILTCLKKLYPNWDAHDLRSVALAQKLGYHQDYAYQVYIKC